MGLLEKLRKGLARTREGLSAKLTTLVTSKENLAESAEFYERLEETLLTADVGVAVACELAEGVRKNLKGKPPSDLNELVSKLGEQIRAMDQVVEGADHAEVPLQVIILVGVNGGGKTTTAAKLANRLVGEGHKGIIAAADTFRAAAVAQIETWADRVGVDLIRHKDGADPSAVVFDALRAAKARGAGFVRHSE